MTKLGCTARSCVNNEGGFCGASYILVEGISSTTSTETFCSNYKADSIENQVKVLGNTNFVGELMQIFSGTDSVVMNPEISCHAFKCFYNGNGKCEARDIIILGDSSQVNSNAICETFIEK